MPRTKAVATKSNPNKSKKNATKSPKKQVTDKKVQNKKITKQKNDPKKPKIRPTKLREKSYDVQDTIKNLLNEVFDEKCGDFEFQEDAVKRVRESTEKYLNDLWEDAITCAKRSGREQVTEKDIELAKRMCD